MVPQKDITAPSPLPVRRLIDAAAKPKETVQMLEFFGSSILDKDTF